MHKQLPIDDVLPALCAALKTQGQAVLQAPPGAGKTTRVPLTLLPQFSGRIVMLEPRRLAARAAASRMAQSLNEPLGQTVGYRMRGESNVSAATRIEVITEGILTRMLQADPELRGVSLVIFDEFHERSLNADLGLALCLEARAVLRPDLALLVMSATLDAAPVAALMGDAPLITAQGRAFAVETVYVPRPRARSVRIETSVAQLVHRAIEEQPGAHAGILVFLPGEGEIRRTIQLLGAVPGCDIRPLFGAMDFAAQQAALAPSLPLRKVIFATAIAETSLTIEGICIVVDGGMARRARYDPASGMSRLMSERVSRAEAEQRRGRAGRTAPGRCYRAWSKGEEGALAAFAPPEIMRADLASLALELALWGGDDVPFLTAPPAAALGGARALLTQFGALDSAGKITAHGRALAAVPLHPRLGHMLLCAGKEAAPLAALAAERDPLRGAPPDIIRRLKCLKHPEAAAHRPALARIRQESARLARLAPASPAYQGLTSAQMLALAYPDRIGLRRMGEAPRWLLSGGKGAVMDAGLPLSEAEMLVASDLDGDPRAAQIRQAAALDRCEFRALFAEQITQEQLCFWSKREGRVLARRQERFGALVLSDAPWLDAPPEMRARAALDGMRQIGVPWSPAARRLRARLTLVAGADWPDVGDDAVLESAEHWLLPYLAECRSADDLRALDLHAALRARLSWEQVNTLDTLVPAHFETPLGRRVPIEYEGAQPEISVRLQEMFGVTQHPCVGKNRLPLRITLLSPAQRPVQVTRDLPGFWATSYADVRKDMRGQYPKHPWPEDPMSASPTLRAKRKP